ncbi:hypothetical protein [Methylobacterium sp. J-090]|uniref:hypothetical protein n=1 Tax=Methylobacterium sp. J-090 TaxID=2836666 RepID=UPI001FBB3216|nr:hypothetical protein [Methylobacterium sp. J-090]MCJ2081234.1 hypothetical protein [Methylobacterium sp. J-090]
MFNWFDVAMANRIDILTRKHCEKYRSSGELDQLRQLFSDVYLKSIHGEMISKIVAGGMSNRVLQINLAWIDKFHSLKQKVRKRRQSLAMPLFSPSRNAELSDALILSRGMQEPYCYKPKSRIK